MAGSVDANVNALVKKYFRLDGYIPNEINYGRTELVFQEEDWTIETPTPHPGITRRVTLQDETDSSGTLNVSLSEATANIRIHVSSGRFEGAEKMVKLPLPEDDVLDNFGFIEFDASKETSEVVQKSPPIDRSWNLDSVSDVSVQSLTNIFEGRFACTAVLSGKVITEYGQVTVREMTRRLQQRLDIQYPFSVGSQGELHWPVAGVVEFTLDRQDNFRSNDN